MEVPAESLTRGNLGQTLVLGRNSKKKRHKIEDIDRIAGGVRVLLSQAFGGPRWKIIPDGEVVTLEP